MMPVERCDTTPDTGKIYKVSDGAGIYYSYSVFESYSQLYKWADNIWLITTAPEKPERAGYIL